LYQPLPHNNVDCSQTMSTSQQIHFAAKSPGIRQASNSSRHLGEHIRRALNKIKKPSTPVEITELLNRDLGPGDRPFQAREVASWLRNAEGEVLSLYWLEARPRR
jgi:hypothetical protein